ncbi:MAG: hypothetical protein KJO11_01195 [Gemmatimonadetes bacterium]|nr:hypothetical protein [Gemmatimonadota bacterium]NNK62646.1 hypothetical protein [Gemmatimonadota bacterium]
MSAALEAGWTAYSIDASYPLEGIAEAHEAVERRSVSGRVVLDLSERPLHPPRRSQEATSHRPEIETS